MLSGILMRSSRIVLFPLVLMSFSSIHATFKARAGLPGDASSTEANMSYFWLTTPGLAPLNMPPVVL